MAATIKIHVSPLGILLGKRMSGNYCPIASSYTRATGLYASVTANTIANGRRVVGFTNPKVCQFIKMFDRQGKLTTLRHFGWKGVDFELPDLREGA